VKEDYMRTTIAGTVVLALLFVAGVRSPRVAIADSTYVSWQSAGAGCVPLDSTLESEWDYVSTGGVGYQGTVTGGIDFVCSVQTHNDSGVDGLCFNFRDYNGTDTDATINASLIRISRSTGVLTVIADVESDEDGSGSGSRQEQCTSFGGGLDMSANYYFVAINATRSDSADNVVAYMVAVVDMP
jgi:hypothetical protein